MARLATALLCALALLVGGASAFGPAHAHIANAAVGAFDVAVRLAGAASNAPHLHRRACTDPNELLALMSKAPNCLPIFMSIMEASQKCVSIASGPSASSCSPQELVQTVVPAFLANINGFCDNGCGQVIVSIIQKCGGEAFSGLLPNSTDPSALVTTSLNLVCSMVSWGSPCRPVVTRLATSPDCILDYMKISADLQKVGSAHLGPAGSPPPGGNGTGGDAAGGYAGTIRAVVASAMPYLAVFKQHTGPLCGRGCGSILVDFTKYCEPMLISAFAGNLPSEIPLDVIASSDGGMINFLCAPTGSAGSVCGAVIGDALNATFAEVSRADGGLNAIDEFCLMGSSCNAACGALMKGLAQHAGCCYPSLLQMFSEIVPAILKMQPSIPSGTSLLVSAVLTTMMSGKNACHVKMPGLCAPAFPSSGGMHYPSDRNGAYAAHGSSSSQPNVAGIVVGVVLGAVVAYFALGFVYKRYAMGMRGADQIPHIDTFRRLKGAKATEGDGRGGFMRLDEVEGENV